MLGVVDVVAALGVAAVNGGAGCCSARPRGRVILMDACGALPQPSERVRRPSPGMGREKHLALRSAPPALRRDPFDSSLAWRVSAPTGGHAYRRDGAGPLTAWRTAEGATDVRAGNDLLPGAQLLHERSNANITADSWPSTLNNVTGQVIKGACLTPSSTEQIAVCVSGS
jgi:hypothetical protein